MTHAGIAFLNHIKSEVGKFCASRRLTEASIKELDQKIQVECYLREKKEAILEDRKDIDMKIENHDNNDEDAKSCLQQVQNKYQSLRDDAHEDARSRRSHISRTAS